jgi:hypothetical protein
MKLATSLRVFSILAIVSLSCLAAYADSDPRVIIRDPNGGTPEGENFSFSIPGNSDQAFYNATSQTWTSLTLFVKGKGLSPGDVSCQADAFFNDCQVYADVQNPKIGEIVFTNSVGFGALLSGILPGESFDLDFGAPPNCTVDCNWPVTSVSAAATTVPEPTTMAFLFTGIGAIVARRKLWKRASLSFLNTR